MQGAATIQKWLQSTSRGISAAYRPQTTVSATMITISAAEETVMREGGR